MRVIKGSKAARQESATSITAADTPEPEPTHDERLEKVAALEELLAPMKHTDAGFTVLTATLDEHLAALGDTERRA